MTKEKTVTVDQSKASIGLSHATDLIVEQVSGSSDSQATFEPATQGNRVVNIAVVEFVDTPSFMADLDELLSDIFAD